jgi:acyl-CoA synthetase (AMP-forming)/AMP-acid ligase II
MKKATKVTVLNVYGMTEFLGTIAMNNPEHPYEYAKPGRVGAPPPGTKVRVVDDRGDEIDKKKPQRGQLLITGPQMMAHYLDLPEDQKMTVRGTWLFTGDVVEIDKDGNITYFERKSDVVAIGEGGRKIFPKEVEPIVKRIPQVEDAAFIVARDRMKKPYPALVIVRKANTQLNEKEVKEFVDTKLPPDRRPGAIFFVDAMPRTVSGAINRSKLRSQFDGV